MNAGEKLRSAPGAGESFEDWPEPLVLVAVDGRTLCTNRAARALLGAEPGTLAWTVTGSQVRVRTEAGVLVGHVLPVPSAGGDTNLLLRIRPEAADAQPRGAERARLARDLHDGLSQTLAALGITARLIEQRAAGDEDLERHARQVARLAEEAREEMRRVLDDVASRPEGDLASAIAAVVESVRLAGGPVVVWEPPGPGGPGDPEVVREVVLVVREAIANALRHAQARTIRVALGWGEGTGEVTVRDDGRGIAGSPWSAPGHSGLAFMRERVDRLGGQLVIDEAAGGGTVVRLTFPAAPPPR